MRGLVVVLVMVAPVMVALGQGAAARCVGPDDVATGVTFTREDGRTGRLLLAGDAVKVNYDIRSDFWVDRRRVTGGVFETDTDWWPVDEMAVGEGVLERHRRFDPAPPAGLEPGGSFNAEVQETALNYAPVENSPIRRDRVLAVRYAALEAQEVTLGGCGYRVIPVEATWTGEGAAATFQRWLYFADLGFAIETKTDRGRFGLTALTAE